MENELKDKMITVKLDAGLFEAVRAASAATGIPVSFVVREALREWVEKEKKNVG